MEMKTGILVLWDFSGSSRKKGSTTDLILAGLESLSDRRVGAYKRLLSPLKNIIPSPAAIKSHYSIRFQLPRRQHGHTRRIMTL